MNIFFAVFLFFGLALPASAAYAEKEIGEGYARPTYKELAQMLVLMGGYNIKEPAVADEYARLVYCSLYRKNFNNDVAWSKIRNHIVSRSAEKKEYFRVLYEVTGIFTLGRYDLESESFPLSSGTALKNMGLIPLFSSEEAQPFCGSRKMEFLFTPYIIMELNRTLTIDRLNIPKNKVERILARIDEASPEERRVYGRIRVQISDAPGPDPNRGGQPAVVRGDVKYVDFFIDREMTKPVGSARVTR